MIGEIEEVRKELIHALSNNIADIDEIVIDHSYDRVPMMSCKISTRYKPVNTFTGGWARPPKRVSYEEYCYNDYLRTMKTYKNINKNQIKNVIFNNPATIVFWGDGSKTVVKCTDDAFDPEKGLAMAIAKHFLGTNKSKGNYYNVFEKYVSKEWEKANRQRITTSEILGKVVKQEQSEDGLTLGFTLQCKPIDEDGAPWKMVAPIAELSVANITETIAEELNKKR